MTYVITQPCIGVKDASCVDVCPVDCIHPTQSEAGFEEAEMLYINPDECIDCGACKRSTHTLLLRERPLCQLHDADALIHPISPKITTTLRNKRKMLRTQQSKILAHPRKRKKLQEQVHPLRLFHLLQISP